jgi:hypothetical protein
MACRQLLLAAEDDVRILHVGGEAVGHVVFAVDTGIGLVAPGQPGVKAAADRAVHQVDDIAGRPHDNPLAAGIGAAAHGDDAGNGAHVGGDFRGGVFQGLVDQDLFGPFAGHLGRIFFQQLFFDVRGFPLNELFLCSCHVLFSLGAQTIDFVPDSPVLTRTASLSGRTKILPSPGLPVLLTLMIVSTTVVDKIIFHDNGDHPFGIEFAFLAEQRGSLFVAVLGTGQDLGIDKAPCPGRWPRGRRRHPPRPRSSAFLVWFIMFMRTMAITSFMPPPPLLP